MNNRQKILIGAWKAYLTHKDAIELARRIRVGPRPDPFPFEIVVCPSFVSLAAVGDILRGSLIQLGAQNIHWEKNGAFTGQITAEMLVDVDCRYVIIGHSELRAYGESDEMVNKKVHTALQSRLKPVICVGEKLAERESGYAERRVTEQVSTALQGIQPNDLGRVILAYEPVWAIRTGKSDNTVRPATVEEACRMHQLIRTSIGEEFGMDQSEKARVVYGGSVTAQNAAAMMLRIEVDGLLIGSASTKAESFLQILVNVDDALSTLPVNHTPPSPVF